MKQASQKIVVTLALLALMAAGGNLARAQKAAKSSNQPAVGSASEATTDVEQLQATADRARDRISESASEKQALYKAVRSQNADEAKSVLLRNGFSDKQLEDVEIAFDDNTGGKGDESKVKVEITASCCPPRITIKISF